ncbi:hypothetical protein CFC21_099428 [Triticum aestivum]|uniref:Receptor-like serine/threonine-protein kinase n=2 Tax=Triticum aestivum TaxID=4565 RepID=A0A9R1N1U6_WHEAT|nr:hypothetical protein CFC21_099428 [Triticum aestivum]
MPFLPIVFTLLFFLRAPASSAATDTIFAGQALGVNDNLVSKNGRDTPIKNTTSLELTISHDGNLVILNRSTKSIIWSTEANITRNSTTAMLLSSGNFILVDSSNSSVLWQSFDHPTDTLLPGAKLGWDKLTGLNRRLVSWKNLNNPATGVYSDEIGLSFSLNQFFLAPHNNSMPYWSTGIYNGENFYSNSGMLTQNPLLSATVVGTDQEMYWTYNLVKEDIVTRNIIDSSGKVKMFFWSKQAQDWQVVYTQPLAPCDVYAICGPFTICNDNELPYCNCMEGFNITSPVDWDLQDRTGGCSRITPLECIGNKSTTHTTDKFYLVSCVTPQTAPKVEAATSASECAQVCLNDCSCTAYSFSDSRCSIWHNELLNIRALQCSGSTSSTGETLYLRVSAEDFHRVKNNRKGIVIGVATGTGVSALGLFALVLLVKIWRNRSKSSNILDCVQGCTRIIAFRYTDLQHVTTKFRDKLGAGSFGSVFKGVLNDSVAIAVKRLDGAYQGEKQFRAEVSSIGAVQHINLVKLVGFCCEGSNRLLVYEYMSNRSLDVHLFRNNPMILSWTTRYQIAIGVARGLAYLHEGCRDCIIHCDIKPENILLDDSFIPKVADFGMAKLLGREFSRVLTTMRGTAGYLAPEWISGVAVTQKVDVYSYGMMLLEIISGKRNSSASFSSGGNFDVYFPVHAAHKLLEGDVGSLVDQSLHGDVSLDEAELACKVACWCIQDNELDRPTMGQIVQILEGLVEIRMPPVPRHLEAMA